MAVKILSRKWNHVFFSLHLRPLWCFSFVFHFCFISIQICLGLPASQAIPKLCCLIMSTAEGQEPFLLTPQCTIPWHVHSLNICVFHQAWSRPRKMSLSPGTGSEKDCATLIPLDAGVVMLASAGGPAPTSLTATILNLWHTKETGFGWQVSFERLPEKNFSSREAAAKLLDFQKVPV